MRRIGFLLVVLAAAVSAGKKDGPATKSVTYVASWSEAVEEAKALNLPIVVHRHGFY